MKPTVLTVLAALLLGSSTLPAADLAEPLAASRAAAQAFGAQLRAALQQALQAGGPVNGITVCHDEAARIAATTTQATGLQVGRTSLKVRNPKNSPDEWELLVLRDFEARKAAGAAPDTLEFYEVVVQGGQSTFRYMKAIPTAQLCLVCHGDNIAPDVRARLQQLYPSDAAYGFQEGDLRGAFTIAQPL